MKIWTQSCRFSLRTRKSSKTRGNFHFFHVFFIFFFIFLARGTWNPGKPWKTMKNNGKPSKTKENEKNMKLQMKKKWKFGLKVADSHSEPGNLQKLEEIFMFFSCFFSFFFSFSLPVAPEIQESHEKQWKTMENHQKQRKMKKHEVANEKNMKIWTQSCRFSLRTRKSSKTRKFSFFFSFFVHVFHFFFIFFHFFIICFSFSLPVAPEIQESHEKQWKKMENHQKQRKMKKNEVANEKKWKFGLKVADSHSEPGNLQKLEEIFIFFSFVFHFFSFFSFFYHFLSFFFHFPCPCHLKSRKAMKNNEKQWKTIKNKGKWKKNEVANEKKWKFGLKVADSHSEPGNLQKRGNFHVFFIFFSFFSCFFIFFHFFFHFFIFFFIFLAHGTWNPGKPWKTMKNNGKPSKTKENEKKMKLQMKKNENLDSKLQILTPNQEIFKNSRKVSFFFIFFSFFYFFFIFLARGTWNPGKPWKTMKNHQKQRKMKKKWSCKWKKNEVWWQKVMNKNEKMKFDGKRWWTKMKKWR